MRSLKITLTLFFSLLATPPSFAEKNLSRPAGTTRYAAMVRQLNTLLHYDQTHAQRMALTSLGISVQGRKLWMVTLGSGAPRRIFYLCRQHGHEPASTEGALAFVKNIVNAGEDSSLTNDLKIVTACIVLMANPDGSEAFLRHNARSVDLNRDWLKRTQPETRALYAEISTLHPDLMTDQHELYPDDTRPDFTEVVASGSGAAPSVVETSRDAQATVSRLMQAEGFPIVSHTITDTHPARLAHRFFSIKLGIPMVLFETNRQTGSGRSVPERAAAQEAFMRNMLDFAAGNQNAVKAKTVLSPSEAGSE